ncbi:hypothetical protein [Planctellipticum variicoloris]|uniref:hypothetical protein n=1 Tax=Planctellipticum variicoloris TaxID=3064265 RepID=UPI003013A2C7|nr:hypothetical protein SH412_002653 [Planctomycetaceae bacterium SH412]
MPASTQPTLPPEIAALLSRLRSRIRSYVLIEGVALLLVLAGAIFWGSFLFDWAWFQLMKLEPPRWLRAMVLVGTVCGLAATGLAAIVFRFLRSYRPRSLALVLERRFPQLDDRLITAVEAAESYGELGSPFTQAMLERTMSDASRAAEQVNLSEVFNQRPLRKAVITAAVLVVSILGLLAVNASAMDRWARGYLGLQDLYWNRETVLVLQAIAPPGDRVRSFVDGRLRHARGTDLVLQVLVAEGKVAPDRVRIDYRLAGGRGSGRAYLTRLGDQPFQHALPGLLDSAEIWITGGDFTTARPYVAEVVDPPSLDRVELSCRYPEYTGLNNGSAEGIRTKVTVEGSQVSVPVETDFVLSGFANKPLQSVRIDGDVSGRRFELSLVAGGSTPDDKAILDPTAEITLKAEDGEKEFRAELPANAFAEDGRIWSVRFVLAQNANDRLPEQIMAASDSRKVLERPIALPPDAVLRITLEDVDGIANTEPIRLAVNGIADQPPVVEANLRGIGSSITRKARIPVAGLITDDYGLQSARFEFVIDQETEWKPRELGTPPEAGVREFPLARSEAEPYARFDVLPLDLQIQQRLTLSIAAKDGDDINGPHETRSQKFVFTVVPVEELLSILYGKELNLRRRFEQILSETKDTQKDLILHRGRIDELKALRAAATPDQAQITTLEQSLIGSAERSLHGVRKNATETAGVHEAFGEIREELVNNSADTPQMLDRIDFKIVAPLEAITRTDYPAIDAALGLYRLANEKGTDPTGPVDESIAELGTMIEHMEQILLEMRKLETFHEAIESLKAIIAAERELIEKTRQKRKEAALRALE